MDTPDAVVKYEPYARFANKPYAVFGTTYTPLINDEPFVQRGIASWYGVKFHGQRTSSGEAYDMYKMTAAHPTLPIPSYARVTNASTGKQVIVRVNDRGPFLHDRIIDLSYTAALKLGYIGKGSTELEVERILPEDIGRMAAMPAQAVQAVQVAPPAPPVPPPTASAPAPSVPPVVERSSEPVASSNAADSAPTSASNAPAVAPAASPAVERAAAAGGYYLQLGAYGQSANAEAARSRLAQGWGSLPTPEVVQYGALYRVHSGPFPTRAEADAAALQLRNNGVATPVVVQR
jgi:rare lipoprotein A